MIDVPASWPQLGARARFAYDNERPVHTAAVPAFRIDRTPVTVGAFAEFVADGGYHDERLWSAEGWALALRGGDRAPDVLAAGRTHPAV